MKHTMTCINVSFPSSDVSDSGVDGSNSNSGAVIGTVTGILVGVALIVVAVIVISSHHCK